MEVITLMSSLIWLSTIVRLFPESGLESAERITAALYGKSISSLAELKPNEIKETFKGASIVEILLQPATSILDLAMKAKCFPTESE